jgi:Glycerol uptake facilitator and related permeases (Major Intrinsic Protein Family)
MPSFKADLLPRIVHALLPIKGQARQWLVYMLWVPVIGPFIGCVLAAFAFLLLFYNVA